MRVEEMISMVNIEPLMIKEGEKANVKVLEMVKELPGKLNIQFTMVSDESVSRESTIEITDKLFETKIKKGESHVTEI